MSEGVASNIQQQPNGKAPAIQRDPQQQQQGEPEASGVGFRPHHDLISVQPARLDDLQPRYAQVLRPDEDNPAAHSWYSSFMHGLGEIIGNLGAIPCCICCPNPFTPVNQGQVGLVTKFGRFERAVDPGLVKINPLSENLTTIDVKIQIVEVPRQVCMTKDNVTLHLTSVIYYQITSPHKAAFGITDIRQALVERTQTTLRHVVGARVLQDVIERREELAQSIGEIIEGVAGGWGVQVESMLIKDIIFSNELQESLSMAAQSKRIGESKIIAARAEVEAAKIRYLDTMQAMAKSSNSKVIFLPAANNQAVMQAALANEAGEGSSRQVNPFEQDGGDGFQTAMNAHVVENI
ncbi:stomatin family protein [Microsporum canis CBS 113480]|uniref:Stomatin family protein n=1 Tax=Arthroderma otae (strain ATCC MYA-4605 / CBS 113480) TaxID=554155 RepID=C5FDL5_ARTOC|nr:stomatin family protein [Microsporum canis CBS 113480]EEQ27811.1 stomatin family protein [Microsporum canis CBS 113480]